MGIYQISIFGEKKEITKSLNTHLITKKLNLKGKAFKKKIQKLHKIYDKIFEILNISLLEQREVIMEKGLIIYPDEQQAEPIETIKMNLLNDIDKRIEKAEEKYEQLKFEFMKDYE